MKLKFLLVLLLLPSAVFAQIQNQKGSLYLSNGEVRAGSISYFYDKPAEISFYSAQGVRQVLEPKEVTEIKLDNGEKFVTRNYKANGGANLLLLKVIIESPKISLYTREDNATEYFYVSKNDELHRLENNDVYEQHGNKRYERKDRKYVATLASMMQDRFEIVERLDKVGLSLNSLVKVVNEYNQGEASFLWLPNNGVSNEANWVLFTQYSKMGFNSKAPFTANAYGYMLGLQYYFSKQSRHSLKASVDYMKSSVKEKGTELYGIGVRYEFAFKKTEWYEAYLQLHVAEFGYTTFIGTRNHYNSDGVVTMFPFRAGIGFAARPLPNMAVYGEINDLLLLEHIPRSFSLGLKYDIGKTNWGTN